MIGPVELGVAAIGALAIWGNRDRIKHQIVMRYARKYIASSRMPVIHGVRLPAPNDDGWRVSPNGTSSPYIILGDVKVCWLPNEPPVRVRGFGIPTGRASERSFRLHAYRSAVWTCFFDRSSLESSLAVIQDIIEPKPEKALETLPKPKALKAAVERTVKRRRPKARK